MREMREMRALLIIGLQIDLAPGGALDMPGSETVAAKARELIVKHDLVVAARFWLPANHRSFAANHPWRQPGQTVMVQGHPTLLAPMYCVQGSFGAEFVPGFSEVDFDFVADMGTEPETIPYSAFYDEGLRRDTGLELFLKNNNATSLTLLGLPEPIVAHTAKAAMAIGLPTEVLSVKPSPGEQWSTGGEE